MQKTSRYEQHLEKMQIFINDNSRETLELRLYSREIPRLTRLFPSIHIEIGEHYNNTDLIICTISKLDS